MSKSKRIPSIGEQWESYARDVLPRDCPKVQVLETRRAFYAGAHATLMTFNRIGEPDISETAGVMAIAHLVAECQRFLDEVKAGRA